MARKITKKEIEKPDSFQAALNKIAAYIHKQVEDLSGIWNCNFNSHNFFRLVPVQDEL
jgi:hypothetical protein